jgi:hypothetical protein
MIRALDGPKGSRIFDPACNAGAVPLNCRPGHMRLVEGGRTNSVTDEVGALAELPLLVEAWLKPSDPGWVCDDQPSLPGLNGAAAL